MDVSVHGINRLTSGKLRYQLTVSETAFIAAPWAQIAISPLDSDPGLPCRFVQKIGWNQLFFRGIAVLQFVSR